MRGSMTKRSMGELERAVMDILWDQGGWLTPGEVHQRLQDPPAYTTVMTILVRLCTKGRVERHRDGRAYAYPPVGIAAATAAGVIALLASRAALGVRRRHRMARVAQEIGWQSRLGGHQLVVLPSEKLVAFSTVGRPGQVVMSRGLITALSDDELAAVVRHEVAHVQHRHQRYLLLARVVEGSLGLLPMVRRGVTALRCAVERWADEAAAGPRSSGRASVHAALLREAELAAMPDIAAFTTPETVAERLEALRTAPARGLAVGRRLLVYLPAGLLLLASAVAVDHILED